jgi:hypothetical protein
MWHKLGSQLSRDNLDVIVAIAGLFLGIVVSLLNLLASSAYMITVGPLLVLVCLLYLIFRKRLLGATIELQTSKRFTLITNIVFWLSLTGSILSLSEATLHRPVAYFILTSLCASMIGLQIIYCRTKGNIVYILLQILILSLSVRASAYFVFPSLVGADPWFHLEYIKAYVTQGYIPESMPAAVGGAYYLSFPVTHLYAAAMKLITAGGYKLTMFLGIGIPVMLSSIFVFLIGRDLANTRVGLLAMLLLNLSDYNLHYSIETIAQSFGIVLFIMIAYLVVRNKHGQQYSNPILITLTFLMLLMMLLTHTISTAVTFCFLILLLFSKYIYARLYRNKILPTRHTINPILVIVIGFGAAILVYWSVSRYTGTGTFFEVWFSRLLYWLSSRASLLGTVHRGAELGIILDISGFLLLLILAELGSLLWLSQKWLDKTKFGFIASWIVLIAIVFIFPLLNLDFVPSGRFFPYVYVLLSIVGAVGLFALISRISAFKFRNIILSGILGVLSFFMITNTLVNVDSPIYNIENNKRLAYTISEMTVGEWAVTNYDGKIVTCVTYAHQILAAKLGAEYIDYSQMNMLDEQQQENDLVIWRDIMKERPITLRVKGEGSKYVVLGETYEQNLASSHNLIYSSDTSKIFLAQ